MTQITTKNSSTASAVPSTGDLVKGELAVNVADKKLYTKDAGGVIVEVGINPTTIDINAGTIDGTPIGATAPSTGVFTNVTSTALSVADGTHITGANATAADVSGSHTLAVGSNSGGKSAIFAGTVTADGLLVGTTISNLSGQSTTEGVAINTDSLQIARNNNVGLFVNRFGTDGEVIRISKDGASRGCIGVADGDTYISGKASNHAGLTFAYQSVLPNTIGVLNDNTVDLGQNGNAFKDLYLSGGAYLGGRAVVDGLTSSASIIGTSNSNSLGGTTFTSSIDVDGKAGIGGITTPDATLEVNITTSGSGANANTAGSSFGIGSTATTQPILGMRWTGASHVGISGNPYSTQIVNDTANSYALEMYTTGARPIVFGTASVERVRIDPSGRLLHQTTSSSTYPTGAVYSMFGAGGDVTLKLGGYGQVHTMVQFLMSGNNAKGSISCTQSATSYNTSSDQRLKKNIADADDSGFKVDAIQVRKFDWKADGSHQDYGMVAQELQLVAPEAVSVDADSEEMMGVDYSKLVPLLTKEVQSLRNRVAQLEGILR